MRLCALTTSTPTTCTSFLLSNLFLIWSNHPVQADQKSSQHKETKFLCSSIPSRRPNLQIAGIFSRSRGEYLAAASLFTNYHPILSRSLGSYRAPHLVSPSPLQSTISNIFGPTSGCERAYHYGRPRGSLWRVKKEIGKEALFVILGMKRFKDDAEKLDKFIKTHVRRLLKLDMVAVLNELERQGEVFSAVKELGVLYSVNWA